MSKKQRSFKIDQLVNYPRFGLCKIVAIESETFEGITMRFYHLRRHNNSLIKVPVTASRDMTKFAPTGAILDDIGFILRKPPPKNGRLKGAKIYLHLIEFMDSGEVVNLAKAVRESEHYVKNAQYGPNYNALIIWHRAMYMLLTAVSIAYKTTESSARSMIAQVSGKILDYDLIFVDAQPDLHEMGQV